MRALDDIVGDHSIGAGQGEKQGDDGEQASGGDMDMLKQPEVKEAFKSQK